MSVEMLKNDHGSRQYCKVTNRDTSDHDKINDGDQGLRLKPHESNKHSYFLRAKTPRFLGFQAADDDEDGDQFKRPSSISRLGMMDRERANTSLFPPSHSKTDQFDDHTSLSEDEDLANCLVMLSNKSHAVSGDDKEETNKVKEVVEKGSFQCKACKKVFSSHQALGGHRASHKKVKGCFASKIEGNVNDEENTAADDQESVGDEQDTLLLPPEPDAAKPSTPAAPRKRAKMHECSVCRRVFASGQALGGHKRCHWLTTSTDNAFIPNFTDFQYDHRTQQLCKKPIFTKPQHHHDLHQDHDHQLDLNLNLPPASHHDKNLDDGGEKSSSKYEASTRLCLQQWTDAIAGNDVVIERKSEEGCVMKLRKLSDLRDVNLDGGWLQMGIPSTTQMR